MRHQQRPAWIKDIKVAGPVKIDHLVRGSMKIGAAVQMVRGMAHTHVGREV